MAAPVPQTVRPSAGSTPPLAGANMPRRPAARRPRTLGGGRRVTPLQARQTRTANRLNRTLAHTGLLSGVGGVGVGGITPYDISRGVNQAMAEGAISTGQHAPRQPWQTPYGYERAMGQADLARARHQSGPTGGGALTLNTDTGSDIAAGMAAAPQSIGRIAGARMSSLQFQREQEIQNLMSRNPRFTREQAESFVPTIPTEEELANMSPEEQQGVMDYWENRTREWSPSAVRPNVVPGNLGEVGEPGRGWVDQMLAEKRARQQAMTEQLASQGMRDPMSWGETLVSADPERRNYLQRRWGGRMGIPLPMDAQVDTSGATVPRPAGMIGNEAWEPGRYASVNARRQARMQQRQFARQNIYEREHWKGKNRTERLQMRKWAQANRMAGYGGANYGNALSQAIMQDPLQAAQILGPQQLERAKFAVSTGQIGVANQLAGWARYNEMARNRSEWEQNAAKRRADEQRRLTDTINSMKMEPGNENKSDEELRQMAIARLRTMDPGFMTSPEGGPPPLPPFPAAGLYGAGGAGSMPPVGPARPMTVPPGGAGAPAPGGPAAGTPGGEAPAAPRPGTVSGYEPGAYMNEENRVRRMLQDENGEVAEFAPGVSAMTYGMASGRRLSPKDFDAIAAEQGLSRAQLGEHVVDAVQDEQGLKALGLGAFRDRIHKTYKHRERYREWKLNKEEQRHNQAIDAWADNVVKMDPKANSLVKNYMAMTGASRRDAIQRLFIDTGVLNVSANAVAPSHVDYGRIRH